MNYANRMRSKRLKFIGVLRFSLVQSSDVQENFIASLTSDEKRSKIYGRRREKKVEEN